MDIYYTFVRFFHQESRMSLNENDAAMTKLRKEGKKEKI